MKRSRFSTFPLQESELRYIEFGTKNSASGLLGIHLTAKGDWSAQCKFKVKSVSLGTHPDKITAALKRDAEMFKLFGEDAVTNLRLGLLGDYMKEVKLSELQLYWKNKFLDFLKTSNKPMSMSEFTQTESKANRIDINSLERIIFWLEANEIIQIDRRNSRPMQFKCSLIKKETSIHQDIKQINKETEMKPIKDLSSQSPEELEAIAKQLLELSQAKKKEIENGDQIRKTLNPLILALCQAKGKYERLLDQQVDVMAELDNAVKALKEALKSPY